MKAVLALIFLFCVPSLAFAGGPKWKIGLLAPLTGDVAAWGQDTQRALTLANEMLGNGEFELIVEDDRCLGNDAVTAAHKLVEIDRVDFGMIVCSEPTLSAAPIFEQHKVVVVAPGATAGAISAAGDYIFRTWPSDAKVVEMVFEYLAAHYKKPAAITEARGFPQEFTEGFVKLAAAKGVPITAENFSTGETDFRTLLLRLKQKQPDVLLVSTDSDRTLLEVVKQARTLHIDVPLVGQFIAGTPAFYQKAGALAEGFVFGDAPEVQCSSDNPGCNVYNEFKRRYGEAQSSPYMVASTIASFIAISQSARSGLEPKNYLYRNTFRTPIGNISFDRNGDVIGPAPTLKIIEHGKPRSFINRAELGTE